MRLQNADSVIKLLIMVGTLALIASQATAQNATQPANVPVPAPKNIPLPMGFVPGMMPGSPAWRASLPAMPHERHPDQWPQPDYFTEALHKTDFRPEDRFKSIQPLDLSESVPYIVLPVQSQAFGFAPAFRALAGAELDHVLANSKLQATNQTDVMTAYGPLVRRLDEETIVDFAKQHPKQKLVELYIGHDGINRLFLTVMVRNGADKKISHRSLDLSADPLLALDAVKKTLPDLLRNAGLPIKPTLAVQVNAAHQCDKSVWRFELMPTAVPVVQACHAIALGSLLPVYKSSGFLSSPAKQAWLTRAYVIAAEELQGSETGKAVSELAWSQLGLAKPGPALINRANSSDPVISRVAKILTLKEGVSKSPVQSVRDAEAKEIELVITDLPPFAAKLAAERMTLQDGFSRVDYCGIEQVLPGGMTSAGCSNKVNAAAKPTGTPNPAEKILFQDWRIAASYKNLFYYGVTLGVNDKAQSILESMPADIAAHPFIQRLRYSLDHSDKSARGFDAYLQQTRTVIKNFIQSTANFQTYDSWYQGHSLGDHSWTDNMNVRNDTQIIPMANAEYRMLAAMKFDRFAVDPKYVQAHRVAGDPAYFLAASNQDIRIGQMLQFGPGMAPGVTAPAASAQLPARPAATPSVYKPKIFQSHIDDFDAPSKETLEAELKGDPRNYGLRTQLAMAMLKNGASVSDAMRLVDERGVSQRTDENVRESHAWAEPAYAFQFSGEIEAAKKYYKQVREIGSGSDSDLLARVRVPLIEGDLRSALAASRARQLRYDNEFAWFDTSSFLFMTGMPDEAWSIFFERAATARYLPYWYAAMTGHRQERMTLLKAKEWLKAHDLNESQIDRTDVSILYLHLLAVTDRLPTDADMAILREPRGKSTYVNEKWAVSAKLIRSALSDSGQKEAYDTAMSKLSEDYNGGQDFMLPLFAWIAWQSTDGKDEYLTQIRRATFRWDFDNVLAKSMVLALDKKTDESLRFFKAARFAQSELALGNEKLLQRAVPASYQYALAGYLMYKKTGNDAYRQETLHFVTAYQKVFPQFAWLYAMEALFEPDHKKKVTAACRARFLDPDSYFLSQLGSEFNRALSCPKKMW